MISKNWISPKEAAEYLGLSTAALARWRVRRIGPPYSKSGKVVRYKATDLEGWLEEKRVLPCNVA